MMTNAAMRAGFSGGLVVDFPHRWGGVGGGGGRCWKGSRTCHQHCSASSASSREPCRDPPLPCLAWPACSTRAKKYFLVLMVGGAGAALPQARGMDGGEPDDDDEDEATEVAVGYRKTKRRKHGDKVRRRWCVCWGGGRRGDVGELSRVPLPEELHGAWLHCCSCCSWCSPLPTPAAAGQQEGLDRAEEAAAAVAGVHDDQARQQVHGAQAQGPLLSAAPQCHLPSPLPV